MSRGNQEDLLPEQVTPNLKSTLAWEMCLDGGRHQMTYEEIKDAARQVEQREDPIMSDDPLCG